MEVQHLVHYRLHLVLNVSEFFTLSHKNISFILCNIYNINLNLYLSIALTHLFSYGAIFANYTVLAQFNSREAL
jgi:hypothetical protein